MTRTRTFIEPRSVDTILHFCRSSIMITGMISESISISTSLRVPFKLLTESQSSVTELCDTHTVTHTRARARWHAPAPTQTHSFPSRLAAGTSLRPMHRPH
jgi:hypothetical protein